MPKSDDSVESRLLKCSDFKLPAFFGNKFGHCWRCADSSFACSTGSYDKRAQVISRLLKSL